MFEGRAEHDVHSISSSVEKVGQLRTSRSAIVDSKDGGTLRKFLAFFGGSGRGKVGVADDELNPETLSVRNN